MKTEVYSWRVSEEVKADLERAARARKTTVSTILDMAVCDWLKKSGGDTTEASMQRRLHAGAARCLGVLAGGNPRRAETARQTLRHRLRHHHAR